jgi:hypothetical protein
MEDYKTLTAKSPQDIDKMVMEHVEQGYYPYGNQTVLNDGFFYSQVVVKETPIISSILENFNLVESSDEKAN